MTSRVHCIVLPLIRGTKQRAFWLWNAWRPTSNHESHTVLKKWSDGFNLEDKVAILQQNMSQRVC